MAEKSALYPSVNWQDCLEFVNIVASFNLKSVSYAEVAKKYGLKSPTAKSFTYKISSCKQFGLITTAGGSVIQLTDVCKRLLYPTGEDINAITRECFSLPPLYGRLIALYDGKALPNKEILSNILMNDHRIQKPVKDIAAQVFLESAEQLGLIKGGVLCYSEIDECKALSNEQQGKSLDTLPGIEAGVTTLAQNLSSISGNSVAGEADYITQNIPFESGKIARFSIPVDATEDDLLLLRDIFDVILKRKFKFNI